MIRGDPGRDKGVRGLWPTDPLIAPRRRCWPGGIKLAPGCGPGKPFPRPRAPSSRADLSLFWALAQESAYRAHRGGRAVTFRPPRGPWPTKALPAPSRTRLRGGFKLVLGCGPGKCLSRPPGWARRDAQAAMWALAHESSSRAHAHLLPGRD